MYLWLIITVLSYGLTQSVGIRPGTPLMQAIIEFPAASVYYASQLLTYGSIHVCGTYVSHCVWPSTWPGPTPLLNVFIYDDIYFMMMLVAFILLLLHLGSWAKSIRFIAVPPIILGAMILILSRDWFFRNFSEEAHYFAPWWLAPFLTNAGLLIEGLFVVLWTTFYIELSNRSQKRQG